MHDSPASLLLALDVVHPSRCRLFLLRRSTTIRCRRCYYVDVGGRGSSAALVAFTDRCMRCSRVVHAFCTPCSREQHVIICWSSFVWVEPCPFGLGLRMTRMMENRVTRLAAFDILLQQEDIRRFRISLFENGGMR